MLQVRRREMEVEQKHRDELKRQAEAAKEAERSAKYQLALAREEERKMVGFELGTRSCACAELGASCLVLVGLTPVLVAGCIQDDVGVHGGGTGCLPVLSCIALWRSQS